MDFQERLKKLRVKSKWMSANFHYVSYSYYRLLTRPLSGLLKCGLDDLWVRDDRNVIILDKGVSLKRGHNFNLFFILFLILMNLYLGIAFIYAINLMFHFGSWVVIWTFILIWSALNPLYVFCTILILFLLVFLTMRWYAAVALRTLFIWVDLLKGEAGMSGSDNPVSVIIKSTPFFRSSQGSLSLEKYSRFIALLTKVQTVLVKADDGAYWRIPFVWGMVWSFFAVLRSLENLVQLIIRLIKFTISVFAMCMVAVWVDPFRCYHIIVEVNSFVCFICLLFVEIARKMQTLVNKVDLDACWSQIKYVRPTILLVIIKLVIRIHAFLVETGIIIVNYSGFETKPVKFSNFVNRFSAGVTHYLNDANPPSFIRTARKLNDLQALQDTIRILEDCGYPVMENLEFKEPQKNISSKVDESFWTLIGTNFVTGLKGLRIFKEEEFKVLQRNAIPYKWSDEYVTIKNELESASRYFQNIDVQVPTSPEFIDDTWSVLKEILQNSRITPLNVVYQQWNKRYNVGPFAVSKKKQRRARVALKKMGRREYIAGFPNRKTLMASWYKMVENFPAMKSIASVFYKSEALKPKKWLNDKIRTPVSSFLPQYLWQMSFSYDPNHRFRPLTTPIKVGMPLNGYWLSRVFGNHMKYNIHYAGDMSDFDSTISASVQQVLKKIRAKGFENHREAAMIAEMIDLNYDALNNSLMVTPSTGNVYKKGTGLTTGHASTSTDNSICTVYFYMAAWRQLTGLSAKEFTSMNELSCYGDDHLISFSDSCPKSWTFKNIQKVMKTWGVTMRDEVPMVKRFDSKTSEYVNVRERKPHEIEYLPFLSKFCRKATQMDKEEWVKHTGKPIETAPSLVVYHDPQSLLGKAAAGSKGRDVEYRVSRLKSYQTLCAHNYKEWLILDDMISFLRERYPKVDSKVFKRPSYGYILLQHYANKGSPQVEGDEAFTEIEGKPVHYGNVSVLDHLLNMAAIIPDVLNPKLQNMGFLNAILESVSPFLQWPKELVSRSNLVVGTSGMRNYLSITPYSFLKDLKRKKGLNVTTHSLLARHWVTMLLSGSYDRIGPSGFMDWLQRKFSSIQFLLNGKVTLVLPTWDFPMRLIASCILADVIIDDAFEFPFPDEWVNFMLELKLFSPLIWQQRIIRYFMTKIWVMTPPNFKEADYLLQPLKDGFTSLVCAGTGTGKSTEFVAHLAREAGHHYNKIIVIEPRNKVVTGLADYMKSKDLDCTGCTRNYTFDSRAKVWYVTAQEVVLHPEWMHGKNLFLLDEAHVSEPVYDILKSLFFMYDLNPLIMMTATPEEGVEEAVDFYIEIPLPQLFTVSSEQIGSESKPIHASTRTASDMYWFTDYMDRVKRRLKRLPHPFKALVFVPDKKNVDQMVEHLPFRCKGLTSETEGLDFSECDVVVSTSVADVAITIPDVNFVITPNFDRCISVDDMGSSSPKFSKLGPPTLRQRKGRTGRTNNGVFSVVHYELDDPILEESPEDSSIIFLAKWILEGLPLEFLHTYRPDVFDIEDRMSEDDGGKFIALVHEMLGDNEHSNLVSKRDAKQDLPSSYAHTSLQMRGLSGKSGGYAFNLMESLPHITEVLEYIIDSRIG